MCDDDAGGIVDDGTVIRTDDGYLITTDLRSTKGWIADHARGLDIRLEDRLASITVVAVQGSRSLDAMVKARRAAAMRSRASVSRPDTG